MNFKRWLLLLSLVFTLSIFLVACGGGSDDADKSADNGDTTTEDSGEAGLAAEQVLNINNVSEPPSLHPGLSTDTTSSAVLDQVFEGLTRINNDGEPRSEE